jgi:hypothetical protein
MRSHGRIGDHNTRSQSALLVTECRVEVASTTVPRFKARPTPYQQPSVLA